MSPLQLLFVEEARENLDAMEKALLALELPLADRERLDAIFRSAHSIKGGAAAFGLTDVTQLTHLVESLLDRLRSGQLLPAVAVVDLLLESVDAIRGLLAPRPEQAQAANGRLDPLLQRLGAACTQSGPLPATRLLEIRIGPTDRIENADAVMQLFRDIPGLGEVSPMPAERDDTRIFAVCTSSVDEDLIDLFALHVGRDQISIRQTVATMPTAARNDLVPSPVGNGGTRVPDSPSGALSAFEEGTTIRVATRKLADVVSLVAGLTSAHDTLERSSRALDPVIHAQLLAGLRTLRQRTLDLQQAVLAIQRVPVALAFERFPRLLRELSNRLGKQFLLVTQGGATELDKALVDGIIDPLTHLVRNSCDHGIEMPHERRAVGKPQAGTITLSVTSQPDAVVIQVQDDGRGLARDLVVDAARRRGIQVPDQMPDNEVWQLVFVAGLSTAQSITEVSGRGVGMDVVRRNVAALRGTVEISSVPGQGCCVSMRLPLAAASDS